jgi:serine protease Do
MLAAFKEAVAGPSASTVRVLADGAEAALGAIVGADGWIVTKASLLKGKIACKLKDGRLFDARYVGLEPKHDLALLKVEATGLQPVSWADSKESEVGDWVAAPTNGGEPAAVGVVGVAKRKPDPREYMTEPAPKGSGYLGVFLNDSPEGAAAIGQLEPGGPAARAGLKAGDIILELEGRKIENTKKLIAAVQAFKAGATIKLLIRRGDDEIEKSVKLGERPMDRGDFQNRMGSELSKVRAGFPQILQTDLVIKPKDCGGPLVNLDGKTIGINIARAGRTESYAIPAEDVQALLPAMKAGKRPPPRGDSPEELAKLEDELEAARSALTLAEKELDKARKAGDRAKARMLRAEVDQLKDKVAGIQKRLDVARGAEPPK